jgi:hypothetical protein
MALASSDDGQQKAKEDIRRYVHGRFHREDEHYPPENALTVDPLVMP